MQPVAAGTQLHPFDASGQTVPTPQTQAPSGYWHENAGQGPPSIAAASSHVAGHVSAGHAPPAGPASSSGHSGP